MQKRQGQTLANERPAQATARGGPVALGATETPAEKNQTKPKHKKKQQPWLPSRGRAGALRRTRKSGTGAGSPPALPRP